MTIEFVLILSLYAFILLGAFIGTDRGPINTFKNSAPRLAARLEKDISVGKNFRNKTTSDSIVIWQDPKDLAGGGN